MRGYVAGLGELPARGVWMRVDPFAHSHATGIVRVGKLEIHGGDCNCRTLGFIPALAGRTAVP